MTEHVDVRPAPAAVLAHARCLIVRKVAPGARVESTVHANPYACINLIVSGEVEVHGRALPPFFVCGPLTGPMRTTAAGPLLSASLVVQPWLLPALAGLEPRAVVDGVVPLHAPAWRGICEAVCVDPRAEAALWSMVAGLSVQVPPPRLPLQMLLESGVAAAARELGCSARQFHRRFQAAMGLAPAAWRRLARWEQAARALVAAQGLADLASGHGYADQAHLTRETRTVAGLPPARLRQAAADGREPWSLRPARVRFVQD